jgi:hypothetical protein
MFRSSIGYRVNKSRGSAGCCRTDTYITRATQAAVEKITSEAAPAAVVQVRQKAAKAAVEHILMADGMFKGK